MTGLPTVSTALHLRYVDLRLTHRLCLRSRNTDQHALVDAGNGDVRWSSPGPATLIAGPAMSMPVVAKEAC